MGENSKIEWTDHTFNPWRGCTKVSAGCANCYAETLSHRNPGTLGIWGPQGTRVVASESMWREPLKWNKAAAKAGVRARVFCASLADVFEDWRGVLHDSAGDEYVVDDKIDKGTRYATMSDIRERLFMLIDATPHLDWLLLTKRPENIRRFWKETLPAFDPEEECLTYRPNVWLLTSVENQEAAGTRIPELLKCRDLSPVLGLSCEPLLGPVDLLSTPRPGVHHDYLTGEKADPLSKTTSAALDWVIGGYESGPGARARHPDLIRSLRDQCQTAGVPFHFKQWGDWYPLNGTGRPDREDDETDLPWTWVSHDGQLSMSGTEPNAVMVRVGKTHAGRMLDGREWNEFPTTGERA